MTDARTYHQLTALSAAKEAEAARLFRQAHETARALYETASRLISAAGKMEIARLAEISIPTNVLSVDQIRGMATVINRLDDAQDKEPGR